jgi:GDPmannose 4,6-dehydratase
MSELRKALICGIGGQDGSYLAELLIEKGYQVYGTSRDAQVSEFKNLTRLGIRAETEVLSMAPNDFRSVLQVLNNVQPDEIYYLAGQSSVGLSFDQPVETLESISSGVLNLLEAIRFLNKNIRLYNAGSSECFGDTGAIPADESTPFKPRSPYAIAKATAHWLTANYRESYDIYACTGILFNHESCLRPSRFVTKKIVDTARRIANGSDEHLVLGKIHIIRDWGWAPEYVEAMWLMLQQEQPEDYVIATGKSVGLETFLSLVFHEFGLDWQKYVEISKDLFRPSDLNESRANPCKAENILGWKTSYFIEDIVKMLVEEKI